MDELEMIESSASIDTSDVLGLLLRFAFNAIIVGIIIHCLYYPKSRRRDYYFTFTLISVSVFFLIFLLGGVKIKTGFALGLFAIFSIIRYRTETMSVREMTYLFVIISISVINALAVSLSWIELLVVNVIFVVAITIGENIPGLKHVSEKIVLYDRVDLITPDKHDELMADLNKRLGLNILKVKIGAVDFLRDTAMLRIYFTPPANQPESNSVDSMLKMPKEGLV